MTTNIYPPSIDIWSPALMEKLIDLRSPYFMAYDNVWRKERVIRYAHWLQFGKHPPINLIGSWTNDDIVREIEAWRNIQVRGLDEEEAEETLTAYLEKTYQCDYNNCFEMVTRLSLANEHMPVWDAQTGSLLPQNFGNSVLYKARNFELQKPGLGISYCYSNIPTKELLSLFIYNSRHDDLKAGIDDPRCFEEITKCLQEAKDFSDREGTTIEIRASPFVETLEPLAEEVKFWTTGFVLTDPENNTQNWNVLAITCFRKHFLKLRYTIPLIDGLEDSQEEAVEKINAGLADYVVNFG